MQSHDHIATIGAENAMGCVRACDCGGIHLQLGPMMLHVAHDDIKPLYELIRVAYAMTAHQTNNSSTSKRRPRGKAKPVETLH